ncbi:hypothetical protein [Inconstantimicrobium porci]|nr:hypothetical protein [Inconstantimicrobium porci]
MKKELIEKDKTEKKADIDDELINKLIEENYFSELEEGQVNKYVAVKW